MKKIIVYNEYIELNNVMIEIESDIEKVRDWVLDLELVICDLKNKLAMIKAEGYQGNYIDSREWAKIRNEARDAGMLKMCAQRRLSKMKLNINK